MRTVIIGGTGHIGSFLTPRLVEAGHTVICVSRGLKQPYQAHRAWKAVTQLGLDRIAEESAGAFGERIANLDADIIIDLTCYTLDSAKQLVQSLRGRIEHLLHCGTIWVHGPSIEVPTTEEEPRKPFGEYGIQKAAIEAYLLEQARMEHLPVTILHPGHLVGPGWVPINPSGNFNPGVFSALLQGGEIKLPNLGMETLHHVHADDVAHAFMGAIDRRAVAVGESFHVVSPSALTLRGYAERLAQVFCKAVHLTFLPWEEWRQDVEERDITVTRNHILHSSNCSIQKARNLLQYIPRYTSIQAVVESVQWLIQNGVVRSAT
jgi:nucleoside-diphosphate-sugar epimerase